VKDAVLVVDDDDGIRESIEDLLRDADYDVTSVANGQLAIEWLRAAPRRCVMVLDLMMPVMDGWQVLEIAEREQLIERRRIIVITAHRAPVLPTGVSHIAKPMTAAQILDAIRAHAA
jgi:CheY-like chemotaxis protein